MKNITLAIIGKGTVGRALLQLLADNASMRGLRVSLIAGKESYVTKNPGFDSETLRVIVESGFESLIATPYASPKELEEAIVQLDGKTIVVDVTSGPGDVHASWRAKGLHIVTANKKALSEDIHLFDTLLSEDGPFYRHEATVGAGLPLIHTIEALQATHDRVTGFSGMLSGTMGAIFSACDDGMTFSEAVHKAKQEGYTEPDPRDDLSGMDIARKALILARLMKHRVEMSDLDIETLVPDSLQDGSIDAFLNGLGAESHEIEARLAQAKKNGNALRYLAEGDGTHVRIGLVEVAPSHPAFGLSGPENLIVLHSERYKNIPMTIRGPGAGAHVTAAGVVSDIIHIAERI